MSFQTFSYQNQWKFEDRIFWPNAQKVATSRFPGWTKWDLLPDNVSFFVALTGFSSKLLPLSSPPPRLRHYWTIQKIIIADGVDVVDTIFLFLCDEYFFTFSKNFPSVRETFTRVRWYLLPRRDFAFHSTLIVDCEGKSCDTF